MRVPVTDGGLVQRQPMTDAKFVTEQGGTNGLAEGLHALGEGVENVAQAQARIHDQVDEATTRDHDNQLLNGAQGLLYDGPNAYFNLKGKAALDARAGIQDQLQQMGQAAIDGAKGPRQKRMITAVVNERMLGWQREIGLHAAQQTFEYNKNETQGRIALGTSAAIAGWDDLPTSEKNVATVRTEAGNLADTLGMPPEARAAFVQDKVSAARKGVVSSIIAAGPDGPRAGQAYLDRYRSDLTGEDQQYVDHYIRSQTDYFNAQAHKAVVDARQEQRAQLADDRQTVTDYIDAANISPRPPAETAAARSAASRLAIATGNTSFQLRLDKVVTENGVRVAFQNATPAELQDEINRVAPATRGEAPDQNAVIRLGTLSQMKQQATAELERDSLSWAAKHMGLTIQPLDFNSASSIQNRVQAAKRVSARTGVQPRFFTDEEAAPLAQAAASNDIGQQRAVIGKLAKLGADVAPIAAQQIAPRNPFFIGLIGLATVSHQSVANALVTKALQGAEVMKAFPKIINDSGALSFNTQYGQVVGDVFRYLPSAAASIRATSRNLLAANASLNGVHENANNVTSGNHAVLVAVNDALGAYNGPDGQQRGGIGSYNGKATILPSDLTQEQFDRLVSRSDGPTLRRAANGDPVWTNGVALTSTELKRLQMTPVGDGKYVFGNGSGIVHTRQGNPFVLDLKQVR